MRTNETQRTDNIAHSQPPAHQHDLTGGARPAGIISPRNANRSSNLFGGWGPRLG